MPLAFYNSIGKILLFPHFFAFQIMHLVYKKHVERVEQKLREGHRQKLRNARKPMAQKY